MKRLALLFVFIFAASAANAQFELTPNGFVDKNDKDKDFIVIDVPGKSKSDLYKRTLIYLNSLYSNPKDIISTVDGENIIVTDVERETISTVFNRYTFSFEFKDGKIKVNQPSVMLYYFSSVNGLKNDYEIFSNKGKVKREKDKLNVEAFYNGYVAIIKNNVEKKTADW